MENIYNTTFVTCCFNCNKNNFFIKTYLKRSLRTLLIDVPLIIYCEEEYAHIFIGIRKLFNLEHITKVITIALEDLFFYKYKSYLLRDEDLETNYNKNAHIVMVNKFKFLLDTIEENPFNTTHFGWIDINLLEKTFNNSVNYLDKNIYDKISNICKNPRDKFTIQLLNQWSPDMYQDLNIFYSKYQWIVAGCFFTMDEINGKFVLQKLIDKTIEIMVKGFGSGEESYYSFVIDENTDKFNLNVGDYQDIIHNYYKVEKNHNYVNVVINKWYNSGRTEIFNNIIRTINKYNKSV
jgi:hypothetical protein